MQQSFGVLVILFAVAMLFQYDTLVTAWLSEFYPTGQLGL
jgi:cytochrome c-type biogenesis protein